MMRLARGVLLILVISSLTPAQQYVGSVACGKCHSDKFGAQSKTAHAHALAPAPAGSPGQWAFGAGAKAKTWVSQVDSESYSEHGLSYYAATKSMALTPGHENSADQRYRTLDPVASVLRCFRCHSTGEIRLGSRNSIQPSEPGVHCEACHGPGGDHVQGKWSSIRNPKRLNAVELNNYCGVCHRKPPEAGNANDWTNAWNIRHQPTYLDRAACFRKSAGALSCLTCHDPHKPVDLVAANYDKRCSSCHASVRHRAPVASRACVDCHMPQVSVGQNLRFTNHWIGIYSAGLDFVPISRPGQTSSPLRLAATADGQVAAPNDPYSLRTFFEQAVDQNPGAEGPRDLGLFLRESGKPADAEAPLRKALQIDLDTKNAKADADRENLAGVLAVLGKRAEALEFFRQAAAGSDASVSARSFSSLAALDEINAETYYQNALRAEETASGKDHPQVAVILNNLGLALRQKSNNASAEPLFRRALAIQQKGLRPNDPAIASTYSNLGNLLAATKRYAEAEQLERKSLHIFEEKFGPESKEVATVCSNLADILWSEGNSTSAVALYRRTVAIDESIYGTEHPEVAGDLTNLGLLLQETGQKAVAEPLLRRALAIYETTLGPKSPQALDVRQSLERR